MNSEEHRPRLKMEMYQNRGLKLLRPLALFMIEGRRHCAFRGSMDRSGGNKAVSKLQWLYLSRGEQSEEDSCRMRNAIEHTISLIPIPMYVCTVRMHI